MLNRPGIFFHLQRILSGNYSRIRRVLGDEVQLQENQIVLDLACGTGNIADFFGGVNITLGLDFVRTSPDHGTGLDIAGSGTARPDSLMAAIKMARKMAAAAQASST